MTAEPGQRGGGRWRPPWVAFILPVVVIAPLISTAFLADERFKVYRDGALYEGSLLRIIGDVLGEFESYFNFGNFRPIGRIVDRFEHTVSFEVSTITGLPPHIAHGAFRVVALMMLAAAGVWLVRVLERGAANTSDGEGAATLLVPVIIAGSAIGISSQSPIVLFPFLYMASSALVVATAAFTVRSRNHSNDPLGVRGWAGYSVLGAVLALFNEITYLAIPIAFVAVILAWWLHRPETSLLRWRALTAWVATTVGFLVFFVPIRLAIAVSCADRACYAPSDLSFSPEAIPLWFDRVVGSSFLVQWNNVAFHVRGRPFVPDIDIMLTNWGAILLSLVLTGGAVVVARKMDRAPATSEWRLPIALGAMGFGIAGVASILAALSTRLQGLDLRVGSPWRESALSMIGWAIIIAALLLPLRRFKLFQGKPGIAIIATGLSAFLVVSLYANTAAGARLRNDTESALHNQVSGTMVAFGRTENADAVRCALLDELSLVYEGKGSDATFTRKWINEASLVANGEPFCSEG